MKYLQHQLAHALLRPQMTDNYLFLIPVKKKKLRPSGSISSRGQFICVANTTVTRIEFVGVVDTTGAVA